MVATTAEKTVEKTVVAKVDYMDVPMAVTTVEMVAWKVVQMAGVMAEKRAGM